jgi:hypothetical protein
MTMRMLDGAVLAVVLALGLQPRASHAASTLLSNKGFMPFMVSPDGRQVTFIDGEGVKRISLDGGGTKTLMRAKLGPWDLHTASMCALSPDGSEIALLDRKAVRLLSPDHGRMETLMQIKGDVDAAKFAWSPDGRRLAVAAFVLPEGMLSTGSELVAFDLTTGRSSVLDRNCNIGGMAWSPDGRSLCWSRIPRVFMPPHCPTGVLMLATVDGGSPGHSISESFDLANGPAWLRQGGAIIAETAEYGSGRMDVGLMKIDASGKAPQPVLRGQGSYPHYWPAASPGPWAVSHDGKSIAFVVQDKLFRYEIVRGTTTEITSGKEDGVEWYNTRLSWSIDDRDVVLLSAVGVPPSMPPGKIIPNGPPYELWVYAANGSLVAGPLTITQGMAIVAGLQCAAGRRVIYNTNQGLFALTY